MGCGYSRERKTQLKKAYSCISDTQFIVRDLEADDYHKGFFETLNVFRDMYAQEICKEERFNEILDKIKQANYIHHVIVVEDTCAALPKQRIIGTGAIMIKPNLHNNCGPNAQIDDLSVRRRDDSDTAAKVMSCLVSIATISECDKIFVRSEEKNKSFYEDYGFVDNGVSMEYIISPYERRKYEEQEKLKKPETKRRRKESMGYVQLRSPIPQHGRLEDNYFVAVQDSEPPQ